MRDGMFKKAAMGRSSTVSAKQECNAPMTVGEPTEPALRQRTRIGACVLRVQNRTRQ
jgi:hypothetical protein